MWENAESISGARGGGDGGGRILHTPPNARHRVRTQPPDPLMSAAKKSGTRVSSDWASQNSADRRV